MRQNSHYINFLFLKHIYEKKKEFKDKTLSAIIQNQDSPLPI